MDTNSRVVNVSVTFKNTDASDALKTYAEEKIGNVMRKFVHHDTETNVVLRVEKNRQVAEASFRADGAVFSGKESSEDLYASIDLLVDSITRQLRRHKEKLTKHH